MSDSPESIRSVKDFEKDAKGQWRRWSAELKAAEERIGKWRKKGKRIHARYQDARASLDGDERATASGYQFRVNLFHSNTKTLMDMVNGNPPKVDVSRRYADPEDDVARVAALIYDRMLNNAILAAGSDLKGILGHVLSDRLLPGLGVARVRYEFDSEENLVPAILAEDGEELAPEVKTQKLIDERAPIEYVHWDDFLWGFARVWAEVPWIAFRTFPTKDQASKRFGEEKAEKLTYNKKGRDDEDVDDRTPEKTDVWDRAEVWEIWCKDNKSVYWFSSEPQEILDTKTDPLQLFNFWPIPEPFIANPITDNYLPQPDFLLAQDLYNEIDHLETRISLITSAIKAVGVYDSSTPEIRRIFEEGTDNDLIPVKDWARFTEKAGMEGVVDWMPIADLAAALGELKEQRADAMSLLYEVTGMSEIMRGANGPDRETAEAASGKRQFASVRVQAISEGLAEFASQLMSIRAEIIARHFNPDTIAKRSNIMMSYDAPFASQAIELIKTPTDSLWRIKIAPESMAMLDYQRLQRERTEYIGALSQFMTAAMPLAEMDPNAVAPLLMILKWTMSGFKGSNEIEGVLDQAIDKMVKAGPQEKGPSPEEIKAQAEMQKLQMQMEIEKLKGQNALMQEQAKSQNDLATLRAELQKELAVIKAEMLAEIQAEAAQSEAAMIQDDHETSNQMKVDDNKAKHAKENGSAVQK
jgi:hypothetical protein